MRLLALLRAAPETHLGLADVVRMGAESGLAATPVDLAPQLETLADHGLLSRLSSTAAEPVFDTVPEPHSHLVYEEPAQTVDLHVSPETLLAILRQALADWPGGVDPGPLRAPRHRPCGQGGSAPVPGGAGRHPAPRSLIPGGGKAEGLFDHVPMQ